MQGCHIFLSIRLGNRAFLDEVACALQVAKERAALRQTVERDAKLVASETTYYGNCLCVPTTGGADVIHPTVSAERAPEFQRPFRYPIERPRETAEARFWNLHLSN